MTMSEHDDSSRSTSTSGYLPYFLEYSLMGEYAQVQKHNLPGVYVMPSAASSLKWFGVIFVREGIYQGGIFKFSIYISNSYPDCDCPIVVFETPLFHPLINPETGELDVKRAFPKWKRNLNYIWQVLIYIRMIFYKIETTMPLNPEAAVLYEKDIELFKREVSDSVSNCYQKIYETSDMDDPHAILFSPWDPSVHEDIRRKLKIKGQLEEQRSKSTKNSGVSCIEPGSLKVFSKMGS